MDQDKLANILRVGSLFGSRARTNTALNATIANISDPTQVYQQGPMSASQVTDIMGSNFEQNYLKFENAYFSALRDSKNLRLGARVDIDLLKAQRRIDLSLLNYTVQNNLQDQFLSQVLNQERLLGEVGLPGMLMPNANPIRMSMKYMMENDVIDDPSQILLNRLTFSIDPITGKVSVPKSNIPTFESLQGSVTQQRVFDANYLQGKRVGIFDVETTGVYRGAQVRSMAIAELSNNQTEVIKNIAFESDQLRGFSIRNMVNGVQEYINFNTLLSIEENTDLKKMGKGGINFLDEASTYIEDLLNFDVISAHNAKFDIDMMTSTMTSMPGFASHERARNSITQLYARINDTTRDPFLIDTLDIARNYLTKQATEAVTTPRGGAQVFQGLELGEEIIENLFDQKIIQRTQIGGSASYASVEAIAMNTNLTELMYKDRESRRRLERLGGQAHQAAYDVFVQSEMAKHISSGLLKIRKIADFSSFDQDILDKAEAMRSKIFKSSAIVPNLNIQDINRISDATYEYLLSDPSNVVIDNLASGDNTAKVNILRSARAGQVADQERILSLGVNFFQETAANEMARLIPQVSSISQSITDQTVLDAYTIMENNFERKISQISLIGRDTQIPFSQGMTKELEFNESLAVSKAFSTIGSPLASMDVRSRMISSSIASVTSGYAENIAQSIVESGNFSANNLRFTAFAEEMSSEGISYFQANKNISILSNPDSSKVQLPFELAQEMGERFFQGGDDILSNLSLSVASDDTVQLVWNIGKQLDDSNKEAFAKSLMDLMDSKYTLADLGADAPENLAKEIIAIRDIISQSKNQANISHVEDFQKVVQSIKERGIVIGNLGKELSEKLIQSLSAQNIPIGSMESDQILGQWTSRVLASSNDYLIVGPFINEVAARINSMRYEGSTVIDYLNRISDHLSESSQLPGQIKRGKKMAMYTDDALSLVRVYEDLKPKMKVGALGLAAAVMGYYVSNKVEQRSIINETMEQQPIEISGARSRLPSMQTMDSRRMDPLLTAGVVGGLDRNKNSHFRMGPNKYDHLYG